MTRIGRSVRVSGRVQGVFFRAWTAEQARELGVAGWVRNCADGSVEARLSGPEKAVATLVQRMGHGPPGAEVSDLREEPVAPDPGTRFEIRHD